MSLFSFACEAAAACAIPTLFAALVLSTGWESTEEHPVIKRKRQPPKVQIEAEIFIDFLEIRGDKGAALHPLSHLNFVRPYDKVQKATGQSSPVVRQAQSSRLELGLSLRHLRQKLPAKKRLLSTPLLISLQLFHRSLYESVTSDTT